MAIFEVGSTSATVTYSTVQDDVREGLETFRATLTVSEAMQDMGVRVEEPDTAVVDIRDDEGKESTTTTYTNTNRHMYAHNVCVHVQNTHMGRHTHARMHGRTHARTHTHTQTHGHIPAVCQQTMRTFVCGFHMNSCTVTICIFVLFRIVCHVQSDHVHGY